MPITVRWDNEEKTILHYLVADECSLDNAWDLLGDEVPKLHAEVDYVTDVIIEFQPNCKIPVGVLDFWRRAYSWMQAHRRETSYVAVVQAPPTIRGIADTLRNLRVPTTRQVIFVDSIEEAHQRVAEYRSQNPRIPTH